MMMPSASIERKLSVSTFWLAQGNFVLAVSEGTFGCVPTSYYDLWRVENGKGWMESCRKRIT